MQIDYYIAVNGRQEGPFTIDELRSKNLSANTLVWKTGLPAWVRADRLPELADINFVVEINPDETAGEVPDEDLIWYAMITPERRIGPHTISQLLDAGINESTPVWRNGMGDWAPASTRPEIMERLRRHNNQYNNNDSFRRNEDSFNNSPFANNPYYGQGNPSGSPRYGRNPQYGPGPQYGGNQNYGPDPGYDRNNRYGNNPYNGNPYGRPTLRTNWLPWAIGATIVGFLFSCIGAIFGIIGIVQANKANNFYIMGDEEQGDRTNSNAKTMTIIGYVLAGIGLIVTLAWGGNLNYHFWG